MMTSAALNWPALGAAAALLAMVLSGPVSAQSMDTHAALGEPTVQAAISACGGDRSRLCPNVVPGGGRIIQCLITNADNVSTTCRTAMLKAQDTLRKARGLQ